jgi:hypothetical protein
VAIFGGIYERFLRSKYGFKIGRGVAAVPDVSAYLN